MAVEKSHKKPLRQGLDANFSTFSTSEAVENPSETAWKIISGNIMYLSKCRIYYFSNANPHNLPPTTTIALFIPRSKNSRIISRWINAGLCFYKHPQYQLRHCGCLTIRRPGVVSAGGSNIVCRKARTYAAFPEIYFSEIRSGYMQKFQSFDVLFMPTSCGHRAKIMILYM